MEWNVSVAVNTHQPPDHRRLMLRIARRLREDDVDKIVYLSEDFVSSGEQLSRGTDLMRCLERLGLLGPGNYQYLLSCLKDVGRIDLARSLSQSLPCPLPHLPHSLSASSQIYRLKLGTLEAKHMKFIKHMKRMSTLSDNKGFWEIEWSRTFHTICQDFESGKSLPGRVEVDKVFSDSMNDAMAAVTSLITALHIFKGAPPSEAAQSFSETLRRFEKLVVDLERIHWKKDRCNTPMNDVYLASKACSSLGEFLSELLGEKTVYGEAKSLSDELEIVATIVNIAQHGLVVLQWFFTATDVIVSSSLDTEKYKPQLKKMIDCLIQEDVFKCNLDLYQQIFNGTQVAKATETNGMLTTPHTTSHESLSSNTSTPTSMIPFCPVLVTLYLNSFVLLHTSKLAPGDWDIIKANYRQAESRFAHLYSVIAMRLFQTLSSIVMSFRRKILTTALQQATELQEVITELLSYGDSS